MSKARVVVAALAVIAGCAKEKKAETSGGSGAGTGTGTGSGSQMVADAGVIAALPAECEPLGMGLLGAVGRATRAMSGKTADGVTAWRELRADCRGGAWYQAGAILLRAGAAAPLTVDGVSLGSARDAVEQALEHAPVDLGLLAYAAYLHGLEDGPLPADACARVTALAAPQGKAAVVREHGDRVAYVCGAAALEAGDWAQALERYGAIVDPPYPDVGVRRIEATVGARQPQDASALIADAAAMIERHASRLGVTDADVGTLRGQLTAAVRSPAHPRDVGDKHMTFDDDLDAGTVPRNHVDLLWGDYIDKQDKPAVGWHSHDPATGNAQ